MAGSPDRRLRCRSTSTAKPTYLGFSYTQFALPVSPVPRLDFDFQPAPNLQSPPVLGLLLARSAGAFVLLAPLDHPHEQVIAVADGGLSWGWHGDLEEVPAGFSTTLGRVQRLDARPQSCCDDGATPCVRVARAGR